MSPTEDDVRRQLDRLLSSTAFSNAGRMSRFLRFVVERTLAGDGDRLKEYVVGVEVFDRDSSYDPRVDSIVRVEAARLRNKLAEYYAGEGRADAVLLTLPKGGYAAAIELAAQRHVAPVPPAAEGAPRSLATVPHSESTARRIWPGWAAGALLGGVAAAIVAAWGPFTASAPALRVAVLPFEPAEREATGPSIAQVVTEGVTAELVRDGRFSVVASSAARAEHAAGRRRPRDVAAALGADVVVEARLAVDGDRVRVEARGADGTTEQKLWVHEVAGDTGELDALERDLATAIGSALSRLGDGK